MMNRLTFFVSLFSLLVVIQNAHSNQRDFEIKYEVVSVKLMPFNAKLHLSGHVVSKHKAVRISSQISGDVLAVVGRVGDVFKKGDLLLTLEHAAIKARMEAIYAKISSAKESVHEAEVEYSKSIIYSADLDKHKDERDNSTNLDNQNNPDKQSNDTLKTFDLFADGQDEPSFDAYLNRTRYYTHYLIAQNQLKEITTRLEEIKQNLQDAHITAPFDGVLTERMVAKGDSIQKGDQLIEFVDISQMQIEVDMPAQLLTSIDRSHNQLYRATLLATNQTVEVSLNNIYPIVDSRNHTMKVRFDLPRGTFSVIGSYVIVEMVEHSSDRTMVVIPNSSIIWRSSLPGVYTVDDNGALTLKFIRLAEPVSASEYGVLSGLSAADRIVKNPDIRLHSDMSVD